MVITYQMDANELTVEVIKSIKAAFKNKKINITVSEADVFDETEYLLATKANRESLERSMRQAEEGNVVVFTLEELQNIAVSQADAFDETNYLLASPANKAHLEKSFKELEDGKGVVFTLVEFQNKYGNHEVHNL